MKRTALIVPMIAMMCAGNLRIAVAQDQPQPKKDTVNIDTEAKPTFYYAEEEKEKSKGGLPIVAIILGAVVVVGAGALIVLKKKK